MGNANIGDRGLVCLLSALALDPFCAEISLRSCGLRGATVGAIACFIRLHPRLRVLDLADNQFSLEAGDQLLDALNARAEGPRAELLSTLPAVPRRDTPFLDAPQLAELNVDLGGTCLDWGAKGPPCGTIWGAGAESHKGVGVDYRTLGPEAYDRVRSKLGETRHVKYFGKAAAISSSSSSASPSGLSRSLLKSTPSSKDPKALRLPRLGVFASDSSEGSDEDSDDSELDGGRIPKPVTTRAVVSWFR